MHREGGLDDSNDSISNINRPPDSLHSKLLKIHPCGRGHDSATGSAQALVLDGPTLILALDPSLKKIFLQVASTFHSVICSRATPLQKVWSQSHSTYRRMKKWKKMVCYIQAQVVELVKRGLGKMTLAVGDGANDVSMIQKADVGVGIAGREGMQAVMASDFAMARFHFLVRLLLVHGHWSYARLARMMLYFFYKNIVSGGCALKRDTLGPWKVSSVFRGT